MTSHIHVRGASLQVPNYIQDGRPAKGGVASTLIRAALTRPRREFRTILSDINLEATAGDRIALLGRNGAGKTSLLRLLSGAFLPTSGSVEINGSVQSLLSLGLGFLTEATVRENIFLRSAAMGLRASQVLPQLESILEFSGLRHAANDRMATLSSGQRMRLGFAVSTCVQHDIMLLDEWFGAGDAEFVQKARERMSSRVEGSKIVVLASHNFRMLRQVCNRGLVLEHGKVLFFGPLDEALDAYKGVYQATAEYQEYKKAKTEADAQADEQRQLKKELRVRHRQLRNQRKQILAQWEKLRAEKAKVKAAREALLRQGIDIGRKRADEDRV